MNSGPRFGNRDYGRPFGHFSVTLRGFANISVKRGQFSPLLAQRRRMPEEGPDTAKRAPEAPGVLEWVVSGARTHPALYPPTPGPAGPTGPASLVQDLLAGWLGSTRYSTLPVYPPGTIPRTPVPAPHRCRVMHHPAQYTAGMHI